MDFILIWLVHFIPQARVLCKSRLILFHINAPSKIILLPALKDRLSRCAKTCQGKIQDKVSINTTRSEASKLQEEMNVCVDQYCETILHAIATCSIYLALCGKSNKRLGNKITNLKWYVVTCLYLGLVLFRRMHASLWEGM